MTRQTSFKAGQPGGCRSGHSTDSMSAFAKPVGILITAVVLLAYSVPTVAVAVLALMVWRRERFWMAFPVTLAFSLQVWAATQVQSPLLLLVTMGVGLAVLLTDSIRQWHPRGATP